MKPLRTFMVLALGVLMLAAPKVLAFEQFDVSGMDCKTCHTNFQGPGDPTHDLHAAVSGFINSCFVCHGSISDNPFTSKCAQCHQGPGLRQHHVRAEAFSCTATCHTDDPTPAGENFLPPLYGTTDTDLTDPCNDNLDNDGDLKVDGDDPNCTGTAVTGFSWTAFKSLFQ